jgi:hypothetical protein
LFVAMPGSTGRRVPRCVHAFKLKEKNMSFSSPFALGKLVVFAVMAMAVTACGGSTNSTPTQPAPGTTPVPTTYSYQQTLIVAGVPPATGTFGFDIGFVDETINRYMLADKATNGIDVVNTLTSAYLGTAGGGSFQGNGTTVAGFSRSPNGGPNGDVSIGNGLVAAGDGNSTLKIVNVTSISSTPVATITVPNPYTGPALGPNICPGSETTGTPSVGVGNFRVDEMAYDPVDQEIFAMSDNACPAFGTIFSSVAPYGIIHQFPLTDANGGAEQTIYDPTQGKFLSAIPSTTTNPNGAIDVFDPKTFTMSEHGIPVSCVPSGFALGQNELAELGCTGSMVTINDATFAVTNQVMGPSDDEVWYSPASNRFYGADTGRGMLVVLDGTGNLISQVPTSIGAHSVAVEGVNDHVFVPQSAGSHIGITIYDH